MNSQVKDESTPTSRWQLNMLPLMVRMLAGVTFFFFIASLGQLFYLHGKIENAPSLDPKMLIYQPKCDEKCTPSDYLSIQRVNIAALLELNAISRRYHQANVALMARVWARYLGFVTGMILTLVGATFILGQVPSTETKIATKSESFQLSLQSASPGIILCVLGVVLMITAIITHHEIQSRDIAVYFAKESGNGGVDMPVGNLDSLRQGNK